MLGIDIKNKIDTQYWFRTTQVKKTNHKSKFVNQNIQDGGFPYIPKLPVSARFCLLWPSRYCCLYPTHFGVGCSEIIGEFRPKMYLFFAVGDRGSYERRLSFETQVSLVWDTCLIRETSLKREAAPYLVTTLFNLSPTLFNILMISQKYLTVVAPPSTGWQHNTVPASCRWFVTPLHH